MICTIKQEPLIDVLAVVQFDEIWLRVHIPTVTLKVDKRQRKTPTGKKVVLLVALGFWTDSSGKRGIVDS